MSQVMNNGKADNSHNANQPVEGTFAVHNIYTKDISLEAPHSPNVFNQEWKPNIDFDLQMATQELSKPEGIYEVMLHITVKVKLGTEKDALVAFLIEVKQAGAFTVQGFPEDTIKQILSTTCATLLFPYAREAISNLATRGGFPQLVLPPINFDAMYAQHLSNAAKANDGKVTGTVNTSA